MFGAGSAARAVALEPALAGASRIDRHARGAGGRPRRLNAGGVSAGASHNRQRSPEPANSRSYPIVGRARWRSLDLFLMYQA